MASKNKKKTPVGKIVLFAVEIVALIALFIVMWVVLKATDEETGVQKIEIKEDEIKIEIAEEVQNNVVMQKYVNYALFGVDSRKEQLTSGTRTDTIMIASVNTETKEVKLVSVYRDTYLNQMGSSQNYGKCNAAYAYGGAEQAIKMLNANLDMNITDFVTVGFEGLIDVVDALGGIYVDVDSDEIKHLNNYQISMVEELDSVSSYTPVTETGYQLLNGLQATAYCRIRYTAGADFKRTERQREVLRACLDVAKTASPAALKKICENVFSEIYTSLDLSEILSLLENVTNYTIADDAGFPTSGQIATGNIGSNGSCVVPLSLESNVVWLHEFLFEETDYTTSDKVHEISEKIFNDTDYYLKNSIITSGTTTTDG